jgi:hypothetical protein
VKVEVTKAHIALARELKGTSLSIERACPVARAIADLGYTVDVCTHHVRFVLGGGNERVMPQNAIDWIARYDAGERVGPFSFELR